MGIPQIHQRAVSQSSSVTSITLPPALNSSWGKSNFTRADFIPVKEVTRHENSVYQSLLEKCGHFLVIREQSGSMLPCTSGRVRLKYKLQERRKAVLLTDEEKQLSV